MTLTRTGQWVRGLREAAGLSQRQLAARLGYKNQASIHMLEIGENHYPIEKTRALAEALGADVDELAQLILQDLADRAGLEVSVSVTARRR